VTFEDARAQFPVLERYAYLQAGTFGPMSHAVHDAMRREQDAALVDGRVTPALFERMLEQRETVRTKLADLLATDAEHVALTSSTTDACHVVLNGLELGEGDEVLTTDSEHFGLMGPLAVSGATLKIARIRDRPAGDALDLLLEQVTPRTKLVATSHVTWITGHVVPFAEVRRQTGVPVLIDGAQSAGAIRVDANEADFYTVSAQKWLCGPDLTGALFVADPDGLRVGVPSYLSQREYDLAAGTWEPREGAQRFDTHFTPIATLAGLHAALDLHPEWRYERACEMAARCRELLAGRVEVVTEPGHATLVAFRVDDPPATTKRLFEAGVIVRDIPNTGLMRASCGWWTSDEDLARLLAALAR
jgi:L-cysteine/cystine lyase